ncbi:MAG: hypothetical protein RMK30_00250 [Anaerolineae bacterium]|nr:hypothetical protein [Anaerolineae bacterium]MDW8101299.1 hypothetical protein [Anaerolineae bacterium]
MKDFALIAAGFLAGVAGSWFNSFLTEFSVKKIVFSPDAPKWLGGLFGFLFITKLFLFFAFCYAVIRYLNFNLWGVIAGILTHQVFRILYKVYLWYAKSKQAS